MAERGNGKMECKGCACPYCGMLLADAGVVELRGFCAEPNSDGVYNRDGAEELWDIEGIICGNCSEELDYDVLDGGKVMLYV